MTCLFTLTSLSDRVVEFFRSLWREIGSGLLLLGGMDGWQEVVTNTLDIIVTAVAFYYLLKVLSDTRAWQLIKGLLFITLFAVVCSLLGMQTINYILVNSISVLAIGVVVLFQPELRRALEAVGRSSFSLVNNVADSASGTDALNIAMIEAIAVACENMTRSMTGALIIIERRTPLGELLDGGTPVILDANLTAPMLEQIFYKNSPLHDGAVLIRNGRIYAARCHIPLSDTFYLRKEFGTRHRAAIGASEIGDVIGVVCSEERGSISVTREGKIYTLHNADSLRTVLLQILGGGEDKKETKTSAWRRFWSRFRKSIAAGPGSDKIEEMLIRESDQDKHAAVFSPVVSEAVADDSATSAVAPGMDDLDDPEVQEILAHSTQRIGSRARRRRLERSRVSRHDAVERRKRRRWGLKIASLALAVVVWFFVQLRLNPIVNHTFTGLQIRRGNIEELTRRGMTLTISEQLMTVTIRARSSTINKMREHPDWVVATMTLPENLGPGNHSVELSFTVQNINPSAWQLQSQSPRRTIATIAKISDDGDKNSYPGQVD
ncbi:MAG: TIGR00159 family protein [Clostridiaceae bacterium]|nr:TIGR00159 family protein [Clostridiaceae bacterium]